MIVAFLWIVIMRWIAGIMVWLAIACFVGLFIFGMAVSFFFDTTLSSDQRRMDDYFLFSHDVLLPDVLRDEEQQLYWRVLSHQRPVVLPVSETDLARLWLYVCNAPSNPSARDSLPPKENYDCHCPDQRGQQVNRNYNVYRSPQTT